MMYGTYTPLRFLYTIFGFFLLPFYFVFGDVSYNRENDAKEFSEYVTKAYTAVQTYYISMRTSGDVPSECSTLEEIGLVDYGKYEGYVCLVNEDNDDVSIYVSLTDGKYSTFTKVGNKTYNYINYTKSGEPVVENDNYKDNTGYVVKVSETFTNKLEVKNGKPVNPYEI